MLFNEIDAKIKAAMLARDEAALRGLRAIKAAFLLAKTEKAAAAAMTEEAEIKILQRLVKQRKEAAEIYEQQGRNDLLQIENEEIQVIEQFLPTQMELAAIEIFVQNTIASIGASGMKDMGKVMGIVNAALAGKADGKIVSQVVKNALN